MTEDDRLYVINFFDVFFREYPRRYFRIVGITIDAAFHESLIATARRIVGLYGARDFVRLATRFGRATLRRRTIAGLARREGVPLLPAASVNDPDYVRRVRLLRPDVIVSVAAPEIFKEDLLSSARLGCINLHSGRLPAYRGMMPTFWQMARGEREATVTVHEMAPEVDAGAVLGSRTCPIREHDTLDRVMTEAKREGARLVIDVLRRLAAGELAPQPVDMTAAAYFSFPTAADAEEFHRRGHRML